VVERMPTVSPLPTDRDPIAAGSQPARNRRTALGLVVWILLLMLASALVAWLRN
jgi:hypothetical protein